MSFTFSMQKILDYRAMLEEESKVRLAQAQQMCLEEEERFSALQSQLAEKEGDLYKNVSMSSGERWLLENFIKGLRTDLAESAIRLRQLQESVSNCKEIVLIRAKERKVLDKLKEKQRERFYAAEKEHERKVNDETATLRHNMVSF